MAREEHQVVHYDMQIDDAQGNGGNSLRVFNSDGTDVVVEFGEAHLAQVTSTIQWICTLLLMVI